MFPLLVVLFVGMPIAELAILIRVGQFFGVGPTLLLVLGTGVLGASLARWQGIQTMLRIQNELRDGKMPADAMIDGLLILIAGLVLLTPGILTDLFGFGLLIPPIREIGKLAIRRHYASAISIQTVQFGGEGFPQTSDQGRGDGADVIDAEGHQTRVVDP